MNRSKRFSNQTRLKLLTLSLLAFVSLPAAATGERPVRAHTSGSLSVNDSARLRLVGSRGNTLTEEGQATGSLPGRVRANLTVSSNTVRASFTIYLRNGSISGRGTARLNVGRGTYASFGGSLSVTRGTGHYAHVSGSGGLYGTINRTNDNATVQVVGHLHV